ncbi:MAG: hypothetical protein BZY75_03680 [SAR202 cluster bacterium Io17-Chloro-G7]|nr:MAG: hypothetical protein BZY75_03680 [SAR202 cluster bacterium Io17-Chloro-G7]
MDYTKQTIGNVEILVIHDAEIALPFSRSFPNVPAEAWAPYQQRFPEAYSGTEFMRVHFECYLIRSQGKTLLVDTGLGSATSNPGTVINVGGGTEGQLLSRLQSTGLQASEVDTVFLTHLHPDHVGWNMTRSDAGEAVTFPNARYIGNQADWDAFNTPRDSEVFGYDWWEDTVAPLRELGVLDLVTGETQLTNEITAIPTPGHTPGSMSLAIVSGGEKAFIMGDVFHGPAQVTETEWVFHYDVDPALAVQTRGRMLDRIEEENAAMAICHHSGFGRVIRVEGRRYWQAV